MTVKDFISRVFVVEYQKLLDCGFHYISFAVMGLGVEFLGACLDNYPFEERNKATARFTRAIQDLFPSKYHTLASQLCADLRNGFAHQFRPGFRFVLTHRQESAQERTSHLGPYGSQTVLVAEDLYDDFQRACAEVIKRIDNGTLNHPKLSGAFLRISSPAGGATSVVKTNDTRKRAYELYEERGRGDGHALDDWLRAEREIAGKTI